MQHTSEQDAPAQPSTSTLISFSHLISALAILALMSGWGIFLYFGIGSLVSLEPPPDPNPVNPDTGDQLHEKSPEDTQPTEKETEQQIADYNDIEAALVLKLQRAELAIQIEELESQISLTEDLARRFDEKMASFRTSDPGRRLATPDNARKCDFLSRYAKGDSSATARQELSSIKSRIKTERHPFAEMNEFYATFSRIQSDLETWQRKVETASSAIDQLLRDNTVTQPMTLQEAIDRLATADADSIEQAVAGKLQDLRFIQERQLKEEHAPKVKLESDLKVAKSKLSDTEEQARQQIESANRAAEEAKQAREAALAQEIARMKSAYPAVRELLVPLTTPGYRQVSLANRLETTADKEPLSYTGLLRMGVLENTDRGIEDLFYLVQPAAAAGRNDRPMGTFPEYNAVNSIENASTREKVKQAQTFVRIHGAAMVRTGLLSE